ncbi:MAG: hypothetical protein H6581_05200 [Bacteroidia bacterium]|nr:hypothetical protein [Bacteroidia bacterium]
MQKLPPDFWKSWFSFEFVPGNGRQGATLLVKFISFAGNISIHQAFRLLDAICGGLFAAIWLISVKKLIQNRTWQLILVLTGLTTPLFLNFFGHVEAYAPVFLILLSLLLVFVLFLRSKNVRYLGILIPLWILGLRLHTLMYLLLPAILLATGLKFGPNFSFLRQATRLKGMLVLIFLPLLGAGLVLYFGVFGDHIDPRKLENFQDIDRLFLPIFSPDPPLDRYNLFSFNHIFDYFNQILLWSPALIFLTGFLLLNFRKKLNWNQTEISLILLTGFLFGGILFAINPLFSMPMDWDLFMFPVPVLLIFLLLLVEQVQHEPVSGKFFRAQLAFILLCLPVFGVFISENATSLRVESTGIHIFKTYYEHASTYLLYALKLEQNPEKFAEREAHVLEKLAPNALPGHDKQYADLLIDQGLFYSRVQGNIAQARGSLIHSMDFYPLSAQFEAELEVVNDQYLSQKLPISISDQQKASQRIEQGRAFCNKNQLVKGANQFKTAHLYDPLSGEALISLIETHFRLKNFAEACSWAEKLLQTGAIEKEQALRIAIHTSLEAELYPQALDYANQFLQEIGPDETIQQVKNGIEKGENLPQLKFLFVQG